MCRAGPDVVAGGEHLDGRADRGVEQLIVGFQFGEHADLAVVAVAGFGDR